MASTTQLDYEESILCIIDHTRQVVNQFMQLLGRQGQLKDAILDPHPIPLQGFTQMITPPVIGHIIRNDHPLVHSLPSLLGDSLG
jgi:hypothetical protein